MTESRRLSEEYLKIVLAALSSSEWRPASNSEIRGHIEAIEAELTDTRLTYYEVVEQRNQALSRISVLEEALRFVLSHQTDPDTAYSKVCREALGEKG